MLSPDNLFQSLSVAFAANFNDCIKAEFHLRFTPFYWRFFATVDLFLLSRRISSTKLNSNWAFKCFLRIASSKFFPWRLIFSTSYWYCRWWVHRVTSEETFFEFGTIFSTAIPKVGDVFLAILARTAFFHWILVALYTGSASWSYLYLRFLVATMMIFFFLQKHLLFDWWKSVLRMFLEAAFRSNW